MRLGTTLSLSSPAFSPPPSAASGFRRGRRADGVSRARGPGAGWSAGGGGAACCRPGWGRRLGRALGEDFEGRARGRAPAVGGRRKAGPAALLPGARAGGSPISWDPVPGRGARACDELSSACPKGLLPPGGDQDSLGSARRVSGPAARGLGCLRRSVVSARGGTARGAGGAWAMAQPAR
jgi:hypothetical protein